jgi:hypothetical protein
MDRSSSLRFSCIIPLALRSSCGAVPVSSDLLLIQHSNMNKVHPEEKQPPRVAWSGEFTIEESATPAYHRGTAENPIQVLLERAKLTDTALNTGSLNLSHLTTATLRLPPTPPLDPEGERIIITLAEFLTGVSSAGWHRGVASNRRFDALDEALIATKAVQRMRINVGSVTYRMTIWKMIKHLSILVIHPRIMEEVAKRAFYGEGKKRKKKLFKNNLLFTFALRNILAKVAFHTILRGTVLEALERAMDEKGYTLRGEEDPIAFVGFNRLMSPNNAHGASISSDIDFKMVFDQSVILSSNRDRVSPISDDEVSTVMFLMKL